MKLWTPRDYQQWALDAVRLKYDQGVNRLLGHAATGLGKTVIALHLPHIFPDLIDKNGLIFVTHRREILYQAYNKFKAIYPDKWIGIEMGEMEAVGYEDFIFASVDSLGRLISNRIEKYRDRHFGAIIVDEGHHATEDSTWDNILTYFGVGSDPAHRYKLPDGSNPLSLFLTATPNRNDNQSLEPLVDDVAFTYSILYGIRNGWLTDIKANQVVDKSGITGKDYRETTEIDFLVRIARDFSVGHRTLCFARTVAQSEILANTLNELGIVRSAHVDAHTDEDTRKARIEAFEHGGIEFMTNQLVFTEGFDNPWIDCIIDNAPTQSCPLHIQKLGRGVRPHPDANVDAYDTPAQRRAAIERSPKPYLQYISTFDPTVHGLDVVATLRGDGTPVQNDGMLVTEVIDIIEKLEEEQPERPLREVQSINDIELAIHEADLWTQTIYNEDLKSMTPLRWILRGDDAAIMLGSNPFWSDMGKDGWRYKTVPTLVRYVKNGNSWTLEVTSGGWNGKFPVRDRTVRLGKTFNLEQGIRKLDRHLLNNYNDLWKNARRPRGQADTWQIKYMKSNGIKHNEGITASTASILIDNHRIEQKLG